MGKGGDMVVGETEPLEEADKTAKFMGEKVVNDGMETGGESPERKAWFGSLLFWFWMSKLMNKGYKKHLQAEDLYDLNEFETTQWCTRRWEQAWEKGTKDTPQGPSVRRCLLRCFGYELLRAAAWKPLWLLSAISQVYILKSLVKIIGDDNSLSWWRASLLVGGMFLSSMLQSLSQAHVMLKSQKVGMKIRSAVYTAVYKKALAMNIAAMSGRTSQGHMLNLVVNDTQKLLDATTLIHFVWSPIIELSVICSLVGVEAGIAVLGGLAVVLLVQPIQIWMARKVGFFRRTGIQYTDQRVQLISEILSGVRVVKYNGWTQPFLERLENLRTSELKWIRKAAYLRSANSTIKDSVTPLASLATFSLYVLTHHGNLSPPKAFTILALFSIMVRIFAIAPQGLQFLGEGYVATRRLQSFLHLPNGEGKCSVNQASKLKASYPSAAIAVEKATFAWRHVEEEDKSLQKKKRRNKRDSRLKDETRNVVPAFNVGNRSLGDLLETSERQSANGLESRDMPTIGESEEAEMIGKGFWLQNLDLVVPKEETVAIIGVVGSGKSSLLLALLSEMEYIRGSFALDAKVAFAPQQPWIFNATVCENITFGAPLDQERYARVVSAVALDRDIALWPAGDQTEIGERGINLSGGQKARIGLARACYSIADIVLLDDPLAAVDAPTANHLMDNVLSKLLRNHTVILVTHTMRALSRCSRVFQMEGGRLSLIHNMGDMPKLGEEEDEKLDSLTTWKWSGEVLREETHNEYEGNSVSFDSKKEGNKANGVEGMMTIVEDRVRGRVVTSTFLAYVQAGGGMIALCGLLVFFMLAQAIRTSVDYWLGAWSDQKYDLQAGLYVAVYAGFTLSACGGSLLRALLFTKMAVQAARSMHRDMAVRVLRSPQLFFDQNPVGRVLNRFSKDQSFVDELLPNTAQVTLELYLAVFGSLVIISVFVPWVLVLVPPSAVVFFFLQRRYVRVSRELKRLDGLSRSPIFSHFSQTIEGISSVRGYGATDRFLERYIALIDANHRAYILFAHAGRWLGTRLDFCATCIVGATALCVVLLRHSLTPGMAGVVLVQSLQLTGLFSYATRQAAETENYFTSVERIRTYTELPTEADANTPPGVISDNWPERGEIVVKKFTMAYRSDLPPVLNNLSFEIASKEKIGILGRSGAGKSTLVSALFRMSEVDTHGSIFIDEVDIQKVGLDDLRKRLSIIPQEPVLFLGTIRQNLDPFNCFSDSDINEALRRVHLQSKINSLNGLDCQILSNGENFSVGQRQLLCLARTLLRKSRIIVMDEPTAAIDSDTDQLIQATIRDVFKECTVLTIAHRLDTIVNCDRILVMAMGGRLAEFDSPANLLQHTSKESGVETPHGTFARMVAHMGPIEANRLRKIVETSQKKLKE